MLKTTVLALAILAIVGVAFTFAGDEKKVKITTSNVSGQVVAVDMEGNTLTVRDAVTGKETIYVFNDTTTFYKDGKTIEVKTLVPDDKVTLRLSPDQENVIVRLDTPTIVVEEEDK
jgi:hypothetical protein